VDAEKLKSFVDADHVTDLLRRLVAVPSFSHDEGPAAQIVADELRKYDIPVELVEVEPGRPNVVAKLTGTTPGAPSLMLNSHIDTVMPGAIATWNYDPLGGLIEGNRMYGRGTSDDKGGVAAMTAAVIALKRSGVKLKGDLWLALVMGENDANMGTRHLVRSGVKTTHGIIGEHSWGDKVAVGYRGVMWAEVTVLGKAAHPSRFERAVDSIRQMVEQVLPPLYKLEFPPAAHPLFKPSRMSVTLLNGGTRVNMIADRCTATLDIRLAPGQNSADCETMLRQALANTGCDLEIKRTHNLDPYLLDQDHPLISTIADAIQGEYGRPAGYVGKQGFSDANVLVNEAGIPAVAYGPGNDTGLGPDEFIEIDALVKTTRIYCAVSQELTSK